MADEDLEYIRTKGGQIATIPKGPKLQAALAGGATFANSHEIEANRPHTFTENLVDQAEEKGAGFLGVARGASMGQTDELAIALGGEHARQYLERLKNEHPYMSLGGEIEGTIIPSLMTGGAAGAPTAARAGAMAESLAPKVMEAAPGLAKVAAPVVDAAGEAFGGGRLTKIADTLATASQSTTPEEIKGARWLEEMLGKAGKGSAGTVDEAASKGAQEALEATNPQGSARRAQAAQQALEATNPQGSARRAQAAQEAAEGLERGTNPGIGERPNLPGGPVDMSPGEPTMSGLGEPPPRVTEPVAPMEPLEATKPGMRPQLPAEPTTLPGIGPEPVGGAAPPGAAPGVGESTVKMPGLGNQARQVTPRMPSLGEALGQEILGNTGVGKAAGVAKGAPGWANAIPANIVGHLGEGVESGVLKMLGPEAKTTLGKMAQKGLAGGARGAVEGGIYSSIDQLNEDRLGGHETNGEKMLAAVGHGMLLGGITGGALSSGGVLTRKIAGEASIGLRKIAGEQAFRALDPRKAFTKSAERIPGGSSAIGQFLIDLKLVRGGDNLEAAAPRILEAKDQAGKFLGTLLDNADRGGIAGPELHRILKGMEEPMARLEKLPSMNQGAISRLNGLQADLALAAKEGRLGFRQAQELRGRIDDAIRWNTNPMSPVNELTEGLKGARRAIEDELERAMDHVPGGGAEYKEAKLAYRKLKVASDAAEDALERKISNRKASPTDYAAAMIGAATGHGLLGIAAGVAHHIIKDRGNATAAVLADKLASYGAVEQAAARVDRQITRGVDNIFGEGRAAATTREKLMGGDHEARALAVAKAVTGSGDHVAAVQSAISPIAAHAPNTAGAFTRAAIRVTTYLAHLIPQREAKPSLTPHLEKVDWSDSERAKFTRAVDIAHDPISILGSLEDGSITPDQVSAMRSMYPELYAQMCDELANKLAAQKTALPAGKRMALAQFLGDPALAGPSLEPMFIQAMQANYPTEHGLPVGKQPKGKGHKAKTPKESDFEFISNERLTGLDDTDHDD
jgi:hypothetical protein